MAIFLTVISMGIDAVITWWVAKHYYQKAGKELEVEANELKKLNTLMLRAMENAGLTKFNRDENGKITGMIIGISGNMSCKTETSSVNIKIK